MKGFLYIDNDIIGEVDFKIIDESMGGIGGELIPNADADVRNAGADIRP